MNHSILESNLAVLEKISPGSVEAIRKAPMDGLNVEVVQTKTNAPSARIATSECTKPLLLHSAYDPMREARRWAEGVDLPKPLNVVMMGAGLGYHLIALLERHDKNIRHFVVVERDVRFFKLALSAVDLREVLQRSGFHLILGCPPDDITTELGDRRNDFVLNNFRVLSHDASVKLYPSYYKDANQAILDQITHDEVNLRTTFDNQGRSQFNMFMNLPAIASGYAPKDCENLLKGYPAVVVAAGPSLDKNVELLKTVNDRALIIVVDTAQKTMQRLGIQPHFIVTGDPTPLNFSHFENIPTLGKAVFTFHPETNRQIMQKYCNHPYLLPMFDTNCPLLYQLFDVDEEYGTIERAMNVGHLAFNVAKHLGCGPVILIGFDFAFPNSGGFTHAKDAAVSRTVGRMAEDGTIAIGGKEGKAMEESGTMNLVPGYYGDMVPTTVPFMQYIRALKQDVAKCDFDVIDATEGGAYFEGTKRLPLKQALEETLKHDGVRGRVDIFLQQKRKPFKPEPVISRLESGWQVLSNSKETCNKLLGQVNQWKKMVETGRLNDQIVNSEWQTFDKQWCDMVSDQKFNDFLGNSVQYLYFARQRQNHPPDASPESFLKVLAEKYDFILNELIGLLDHFTHTVELSVTSLKQHDEVMKAGKK